MRKLLNTLYVTSENSYLSLGYRCIIWKGLFLLAIEGQVQR